MKHLLILRKNWLTGFSRRLQKVPAILYRKRQKWDVWGDVCAQAGFEPLDLMTKRVKKENLLWFLRENEMDDLGVAGILGRENFEWQKERCEAEFVKELDLNE